MGLSVENSPPSSLCPSASSLLSASSSLNVYGFDYWVWVHYSNNHRIEAENDDNSSASSSLLCHLHSLCSLKRILSRSEHKVFPSINANELEV
ncbi:hypothetical protein COLO4_37072 [Corchorus olitorius]|uniref:Uncharacterized protein n=1 Tax=Corchorus olitorius TaxID=93759 RepID=A0A1R3G3I2_9ROSI|nr:hypothetical protein COLO4_37072 [Corchorus olitorius]